MHYGEKFNSITHLIGTALAATGAIVLIMFAVRQDDPWKIASFSVFGAMLTLLYATSTLYHCARGPIKPLLRKIDHCAIYLLIAGTYMPFTLICLRGTLGWSLFGVVWGVAMLGILQEIWTIRGGRVLAVVSYVTLGWLAVLAATPLTHALKPGGFTWLAIGGVFYTVGVLFYAFDKKWRHAHGIWHLFVMAGSGSHYVAVLFFIV